MAETRPVGTREVDATAEDAEKLGVKEGSSKVTEITDGDLQGVRAATEPEAQAEGRLSQIVKGKKDLKKGFFEGQRYTDENAGELDMKRLEAGGNPLEVDVEGEKKYVTLEKLAKKNGYRLTETGKITPDERTKAHEAALARAPAQAAATATTAQATAGAIPPSSEFDKTRKVKGKDVPLYDGDPAKGDMSFPKGANELKALAQAVYNTVEGTHEAKATAVRDYLGSVKNNDYQARLNDLNNATKTKGALDAYDSPLAYAESRSLPASASEEEKKAFEKEYNGQPFSNKSDPEQWNVLYGIDATADKDEFRDALFNSGGQTEFGDSHVGDWAGTGDKRDHERVKEAYTAANDALKPYDDKVKDLEGEREKLLKQIDAEAALGGDADTEEIAKLGVQREELDKELDKARAERDDTKNALRDALQNPKKLEKMTNGEFVTSKGENRLGAEERSKTRGGFERGVEKAEVWGGHADKAWSAGWEIADKIQTQLQKGDTMMQQGEKTFADARKEARDDVNTKREKRATPLKEMITKTLDKIGKEPQKGSNQEALRTGGSQAGTAPTAQPGSMLARKKDSEGKHQQGERSEETVKEEDEAARLAALARQDRY